jgi:hypothetical protein
VGGALHSLSKNFPINKAAWEAKHANHPDNVQPGLNARRRWYVTEYCSVFFTAGIAHLIFGDR